MKRAGIITLFDLKNYGNRLQAYALSKAIRNLGYRPVELIVCKKNRSFFRNIVKISGLLTVFCNFLIEILRGTKLKVAIKKCKRFYLFSLFSNKIKKKIVFSGDALDYYICGSDQIWNPDFAGQSHYFAAFAPKKKRISYAASFGVSKLPEEVCDRYKKNISDMNYISVRESRGAQIIKELTGRDAQVVIDPTLMLGKDEWSDVSKKPTFKVPDKYILAYFLGDISEKTSEYIKRIAEEKNLKIILLHKKNQNDYWNYTGPSEFIWLIKNASLVCTDSFHACVFSIIMDSPFIVFKRAGNNDMHSRIENLLGMFKLSDRFFENVQKGDELKNEYEHVAEILRLEREKAFKFLTEALEL